MSKPRLETSCLTNHFGKLIYHLIIDDKIMMSNDLPEYQDIERAIKTAHGNCWVCGLGLGIIANELAKLPQVQTVTIAEINQDVIDLCSFFLESDKCKVFYCNGLTDFWINPEIKFYDWMFFDSYLDIQEDGPEHVKQAWENHKPYLKPGGTFECWMKPYFENILI